METSGRAFYMLGYRMALYCQWRSQLPNLNHWLNLESCKYSIWGWRDVVDSPGIVLQVNTAHSVQVTALVWLSCLLALCSQEPGGQQVTIADEAVQAFTGKSHTQVY